MVLKYGGCYGPRSPLATIAIGNITIKISIVDLVGVGVKIKFITALLWTISILATFLRFLAHSALVDKKIFKHSYYYWSKKIQLVRNVTPDEDIYSLLLFIFDYSPSLLILNLTTYSIFFVTNC